MVSSAAFIDWGYFLRDDGGTCFRSGDRLLCRVLFGCAGCGVIGRVYGNLLPDRNRCGFFINEDFLR